mgnify:FL=1
MKVINLNKQSFIDFYNSTDSYETFQNQLKDAGINISILRIKEQLKSIGLEPKNRKRGTRVEFVFDETEVVEPVETLMG